MNNKNEGQLTILEINSHNAIMAYGADCLSLLATGYFRRPKMIKKIN